MANVIGISLGYHSCCTAVYSGEKVVFVGEIGVGGPTPADVAYVPTGEVLVGNVARRLAKVDSANTFTSVTRLLGRSFDSIVSEDPKVIADHLVEIDHKGDPIFIVRGQRLTSTMLVAPLLARMKQNAEFYLGKSVNKAVIAVPDTFNENQRQLTKESARLAGLDVIETFDRPLTVVEALRSQLPTHGFIIVSEHSKDALNISFVNTTGGKSKLAHAAESRELGEDGIVKKVIEWLADQCPLKYNKLRNDRLAIARLWQAAECALEELRVVDIDRFRRVIRLKQGDATSSFLDATDIYLPFISTTPEGPIHIETKLKRSIVDAIITDWLVGIENFHRAQMTMAGVHPGQISAVIFLSAHSTLTYEVIKNIFGIEPNCKADADQFAAIGAAIQAGVLAEENKYDHFLSLDVTPLSIGIRTAGGLCHSLISRNTMIPTQKSMIFTTATDFQTKMNIEILQGESTFAEKNRTLGKIEIRDIPVAPRGVAQVKVTIEIDQKGIVYVSASDLATGKIQSVSMSSGKSLDEWEIESMIAEAERFERDSAANLTFRTIENARKLCFVVQQLFQNLSYVMHPEMANELSRALPRLQEIVGYGNPETVISAMAQLNCSMSNLFLTLETSPSPKGKGMDMPHGKPKESQPGENPLTGFHALSSTMGGMGKVTFLLKENQRFVVKTLREDRVTDRDAIQRAIAEARTWMNLERHTNIVCALMVKDVGGMPLLFLEYADGGDLSQWIGKILMPQALDVAIQFCTGMKYAYDKLGIVHRDIKPANVLLSHDNRFPYGYAVKVTDFGLAGAILSASTQEVDFMETQLSRGMGTWPYMAPEQFSESIQKQFGFTLRPVTVLSDLYSFGILFYELLTGYLPYPDVKSIFTSPPADPRLINKTLPIELSHLILRCLEKKPEDRYKGWDDVIIDLLSFYNRVTSDQYIIKGGPEPLTHLDWIAKGASLFALGDYEEGQRCYDKALTLASAFPPAWYGKGLCLECLGQTDGAIQCFNAAIEVNPYLAEAFCGKARCLLCLQRFGEAVACYERAYEAQLLTSIGSD